MLVWEEERIPKIMVVVIRIRKNGKIEKLEKVETYNLRIEDNYNYYSSQYIPD